MVEFPSAPIKATPGRRAAALLGLLAVLLLQVSLAAHQFDHAGDHGFDVCQVCTSYSQLDDAPTFALSDFALSVIPHAAVEMLAAGVVPASLVSYNRSRAPPLS